MAAPPITCRVELFGVARLAAGTNDVALSLRPGSTVSDALASLARECPALVGKVVDEAGSRLLEGYTLNLNGTAFVADMNTAIQPGDAVLVLSAEAGG